MPRKEKEQCINPTCKNEGVARGLCRKCINHVYWLILSGQFTNEQLVEAGKILPAHHAAKTKKDWFKEEI
jgi:hypothetical protein